MATSTKALDLHGRIKDLLAEIYRDTGIAVTSVETHWSENSSVSGERSAILIDVSLETVKPYFEVVGQRKATPGDLNG
jgi:hypothetical protein